MQCISKYLHQTIDDCLDKFSAYLLWWLLPLHAHRTSAKRWRHTNVLQTEEWKIDWSSTRAINTRSVAGVRSLLLFRRSVIFNCNSRLSLFFVWMEENVWMNFTYRSSKNINFISISARNMNIFWLSFISVTWECGNECPTATKPKFCTQLCPSP